MKRSRTHQHESMMERRLRLARGQHDADTNDLDDLDDLLDDAHQPDDASAAARQRFAHNDEQPHRQRESIMERRLRVARGEAPDEGDDGDEPYRAYHRSASDYDFDPYDDDRQYQPRRRNTNRSAPPPAPHYMMQISGRTNWVQSMFYIVLGTLSLIFIVMLLSSDQVLTGIRERLFGSVPEVQMPFVAPTPTIRTDAPTVLQRVQRLNRLEVTSYTFEKVIEGSVQGNALQNILMHDRLLLIAHGTVTAGIDLSKLTLDDITISEDGTTIRIYLPPVEVFNTNLDTTQTRVVSREQGLLAPANPELETNARQVAAAEILKAACESGMMQRATNDSRRAMEQFLGLLDFQQIEVIAGDIPPCPDMPTHTTTP